MKPKRTRSGVPRSGHAEAGNQEIASHLAELRRRRGISAARLAQMIGISRQTVYAMEAGEYVPNTAVALKLARALEVNVEDLFTLEVELPAPELAREEAILLPGADLPQPGQPVQLCRVEERLIASPPSPMRWYFPASDAIVARKSSSETTEVQVFDAAGDFGNRIFVAGCDPGASVLARHLHSAGVNLVLAHSNSSHALRLLKEGFIHIAGTHIGTQAIGQPDTHVIGRFFPTSSVAVFSFAIWEEGIVTARGNPKQIREVADFARPEITIVNREKGAGSRFLLDHYLKRAGVDSARIRGYHSLAPGHLAAAWRVHSGLADCCIATAGAARIFGLGFIPLSSEHYELVIRRKHLDLPAIQALLDTLNRSRFRRELETLGGYDTSIAGRRVL